MRHNSTSIVGGNDLLVFGDNARLNINLKVSSLTINKESNGKKEPSLGKDLNFIGNQALDRNIGSVKSINRSQNKDKSSLRENEKDQWDN